MKRREELPEQRRNREESSASVSDTAAEADEHSVGYTSCMLQPAALPLPEATRFLCVVASWVIDANLSHSMSCTSNTTGANVHQHHLYVR
jgi:hypothetical protein